MPLVPEVLHLRTPPATPSQGSRVPTCSFLRPVVSSRLPPSGGSGGHTQHWVSFPERLAECPTCGSLAPSGRWAGGPLPLTPALGAAFGRSLAVFLWVGGMLVFLLVRVTASRWTTTAVGLSVGVIPSLSSPLLPPLTAESPGKGGDVHSAGAGPPRELCGQPPPRWRHGLLWAHLL